MCILIIQISRIIHFSKEKLKMMEYKYNRVGTENLLKEAKLELKLFRWENKNLMNFNYLIMIGISKVRFLFLIGLKLMERLPLFLFLLFKKIQLVYLYK